MPKPGDRVGAIVSANAQKVVMFGYGVYEGDFVPDQTAAVMGGIRVTGENPRIRLDNGQVCWGYQCWWGPEERIKAEVMKYEAMGASVEYMETQTYQKEVVKAVEEDDAVMDGWEA